MANEGMNSGKGLPIPYLTAAWSGMSHEDIRGGLKRGSILPPPGAPANWMPDWAPMASRGSRDASTIQADPVDRARVEGWLSAIDPEVSDATLDSIWAHAGKDDATRASALTSYLGSALLSPATADDETASSIESIATALDARLASGTYRAQVLDLVGKTGDEIATLAHADVGVRYALAHMQPVALTGNRALFAAGVNADGSLDRFDPDTGEAMISDAYLADRGKFLAWKASAASGDAMAVAGDQDWTFVDRNSLDSDGSFAKVEIKTGASDAGVNQVVFGSESGEVIKGVSGSDRIYGAGGDDALRGGAGGDHLEGGAGADLVMGGAGNDELTGDRGDDELEGGAGADSLGGGAGDDFLSGGRGDDQLDGGTGHDTYAFDEGEGSDTIIDADGDGSIEIEGVAVQGTMHPGDGKWTSADGTLDFTLSAESTLTIKAFASGASHSDSPGNVISVKNWKNGDLGITLDGNAAESPASPSLAAVLAQPEVPVADFADAVAPQGESAHDATPAESADSVASTASAIAGDGGDASNGDSDVDAGELVGEGAFDSSAYDAALAALLGDVATVPTVDAAAVHDAIQSFAGVLEPPDVSSAVFAHADGIAGMVTDVHLADALAGDFAADASEIGAADAMASVVPQMDWSAVLEQQAGRTATATGTLAKATAR